MKISIKDNIKEVTKQLSRVQKNQIPFAAMLTINELAKDLSKKGGTGVIGKATGKKFKKKSGTGATKFTKRNFFYKQATKQSLTATVYWDDRNADYMKFMVFGGTRFPAKRALAIPTKHANKHLNSFGNFRKGAINTLLSDKSKYFKGTPKGSRFDSEGVWERYGRKTKKGGQKIRMLVAFEKEAKYKSLFPFEKIATSYVASKKHGFEPKFGKHLAKALLKPR